MSDMTLDNNGMKESNIIDALDLKHDPTSIWEQIRNDQTFVEPFTYCHVNYENDAVVAHARTIPRESCTRFVVISDTHGKHRQISIPQNVDADILLHSGDFTIHGERSTIEDINQYFGELKEQQIIKEQIFIIAGNHDIPFDTEFYVNNWERFQNEYNDPNQCRKVLQESTNCVYLEDTSYTIMVRPKTKEKECNKNKFIQLYGSPWTPTFYNWAFNLDRGNAISEKWKQIPTTTDVLITHGPPLGRSDLVPTNEYSNNTKYTTPAGIRAGCYDLLMEVQNRIKPRLHIFGHIHEGYGITFDGTTLYVNASNVDLQYQVTNPCIVIDLPHDKSKPAIVVRGFD